VLTEVVVCLLLEKVVHGSPALLKRSWTPHNVNSGSDVPSYEIPPQHSFLSSAHIQAYTCRRRNSNNTCCLAAVLALQ